MSFDPDQFRWLIREALTFSGLGYNQDSEELLFATAAHESHLGTYLRQVNGPASGVFQMEPDTLIDIWESYLYYRPRYQQAVYDGSGVSHCDTWALKSNLAYQIIMARFHYLRIKQPLPDHRDVDAIAVYWKKHWNSNQGRGTVKKFKEDYKRFTNG